MPRTTASVVAALVLLASPSASAFAADAPAPSHPANAPITQREESVGRAVATPLEDLNIRSADIPEPLQRAVADPYDLAGMTGCQAVAEEVDRLDAALGPDRDANSPRAPQRARGARILRAGVEGVIPYRGWLRQLTGAARRQAMVQDAVVAGSTRRGYLKGMGMRMNCAPPAAPEWFRPAVARRPAPLPRRR